ncbi:exopolysaccharide biosynthesis polyprenyl glycosylphosphotransferase [Sphingomonas floccifaciens]|uniref:Exopolysaccharide biosynthesis polyprenyl glycosylphosphotransferase n=1 Tax=Sphingomonas floccifaciens TaxID=1844115 RepID=A0ABW4N9A8_9SPHN
MTGLRSDARTLQVPAQRFAPPRWTAQTTRLVLYGVSLLLDTVAVAGAFLLTDSLLDQIWLPIPKFAFLMITLSLFVMFSISKESQSIETLKSPPLGVQRSVASLIAAFLVAMILIFLTQLGEQISRFGFVLFFAFAFGLLLVSRGIVTLATKMLLGHGIESTVLLLDGPKIDGERGMVVIDAAAAGLRPDLSQPASIARVAEVTEGFDRIIVACDDAQRATWSVFLQGARAGGEILVGTQQSIGAVGIGRCAMRDTLIVSRGPLSFSSQLLKRALDLAITVPLVIFIAPLLIGVAIAIKLESRGPVFFRQERVGQDNRNFRIYKFRSMRLEVLDATGARSASRDDDRISRVGRFIRRTSIDELPQLFNVILGDMSLVGPRPHALGSLAGSRLFWEVDPRYWQRHSLKPGMTGLAQIRGFRGATDNAVDLENRLQCDLEYLGSWSIWLDLQIMMSTFKVLVHHKAY